MTVLYLWFPFLSYHIIPNVEIKPIKAPMIRVAMVTMFQLASEYITAKKSPSPSKLKEEFDIFFAMF